MEVELKLDDQLSHSEYYQYLSIDSIKGDLPILARQIQYRSRLLLGACAYNPAGR